MAKPRRAEDNLVFRNGVYKIVKIFTREAIDKLDDSVIDSAELRVVDALEICDVNHNKVFIKLAMKGTLNDLLVSILDEPLSVRKPFENAIFQVAMAKKLLAITASTAARDTADRASDRRYAAKIVVQKKRRVNERPSSFSNLPSHHRVLIRILKRASKTAKTKDPK